MRAGGLVKQVGFFIFTAIWMVLGFGLIIVTMAMALVLLTWILGILIWGAIDNPAVFVPLDTIAAAAVIYVLSLEKSRAGARELWRQIWNNK